MSVNQPPAPRPRTPHLRSKIPIKTPTKSPKSGVTDFRVRRSQMRKTGGSFNPPSPADRSPKQSTTEVKPSINQPPHRSIQRAKTLDGGQANVVAIPLSLTKGTSSPGRRKELWNVGKKGSGGDELENVEDKPMRPRNPTPKRAGRMEEKDKKEDTTRPMPTKQISSLQRGKAPWNEVSEHTETPARPRNPTPKHAGRDKLTPRPVFKRPSVFDVKTEYEGAEKKRRERRGLDRSKSKSTITLRRPALGDLGGNVSVRKPRPGFKDTERKAKRPVTPTRPSLSPSRLGATPSPLDLDFKFSGFVEDSSLLAPEVDRKLGAQTRSRIQESATEAKGEGRRPDQTVAYYPGIGLAQHLCPTPPRAQLGLNPTTPIKPKDHKLPRPTPKPNTEADARTTKYADASTISRMVQEMHLEEAKENHSPPPHHTPDYNSPGTTPRTPRQGLRRGIPRSAPPHFGLRKLGELKTPSRRTQESLDRVIDGAIEEAVRCGRRVLTNGMRIEEVWGRGRSVGRGGGGGRGRGRGREWR